MNLTHSPAELTEILPGFMCDVAQAKVWTVGLLLLVVMTPAEVFLHVTLIWDIFDISPAKDKKKNRNNIYLWISAQNEIGFDCVCMYGGTLPQHFKFGKVNRVLNEHREVDGLH